VDFEMPADSDGVHEALQTEVGDDWVLSFVQDNAEDGEVG